METWDAYDKDFNKVHDVTLIIGEAIPEGLFHMVCDIIVKHTDGNYLLMQRDRRKQFGGMWEATAGGSALQKFSQFFFSFLFCCPNFRADFVSWHNQNLQNGLSILYHYGGLHKI